MTDKETIIKSQEAEILRLNEAANTFKNRMEDMKINAQTVLDDHGYDPHIAGHLQMVEWLESSFFEVFGGEL